MNICSVVFLPALKPACCSAFDLFRLWLKSAYGDLQYDCAWIANKADGSVVLAPLQVSFLCESDNQGFSPVGWNFSRL